MSISERASERDIGRRRLRVFAVLIALLFGGLALSSWWFDRENLREGSKLVAEGGEPLAIGDIPTTYRATYRFENRAQGDLTVTTEKVWVRRPFSSRVESFRGTRTDGEPSTLRLSAFGQLYSRSEGTPAPLDIAVPPSLSSGDLRPDAVLAELVRSEAVDVREQREVFGRRCQVYRTGGSVLAGDVPAYEPGKGEYADVCIDRNGIVLEEYWVSDGELLRRRVATDVEVDVAIARSTFAVTDGAPAPDSGIQRGAVERISSEPAGGEGLPLWTLPGTPDGFDRLGRYAVVLSPSAVPSLGGERPTVGPSSTSDVYVRGPDVIVIDQDPSLATLASFDARVVRDIDLEALKDGKLVVDARMSEVRGATGDGSLVRIFGTVPTDELIELANQLRPETDD
jgi:hypothetical protein